MKFMKLNLTIVILVLLFSANAAGQIWLSNEDIYQTAEEFYNAEEYIEALPLYLLLEKKDIVNANINYKIGACYLNIRGRKAKSIPYLVSASENCSSDYVNSFSETKAPLESILFLGMAYRINNQLSKAEKTLRIYADSAGDDNTEAQTIVEIQLERIKNARLLGAFPGDARTERLPATINNSYSNYNPVLVGHDSMLLYMEERPFYDALMRSVHEGTSWSTPENLTPAVGSDGDHILVGASSSGEQLFLYIYQPMEMGEIYTTHYKNNEWTKLEPLNDNINTKYNETHASVSPDGQTLYFTSNRPGGFGGLDIYKSELDQNGEWGSAMNLGPVINTSFNEDNPIINSDDEILYFSSEGHLNMGGYDVFYSLRRGENKWRQPINMGSPVSTTDDDLFYYPLESTVSGLMSRLEEPDSRGYDIYQYNSMTFANSPRFTVRGKANGADSTNYKDYTISVIDSVSGKEVYSTQPEPDGQYNILLPAGTFTIVAAGPVSDKEINTVSIAEDTEEPIVLQALPVPVVADDSESAGGIIPKSTMDTIRIQTIYFAFDDYDLPKNSKDFLIELANELNRYPGIKIMIQGHTDDLGSEDYNLRLSKKRAAIVAEFLVKNKVQQSQISTEGKGEEMPVARNHNTDGSDDPEGRALNRRVIILPQTQVENVMIIQP